MQQISFKPHGHFEFSSVMWLRSWKSPNCKAWGKKNLHISHSHFISEWPNGRGSLCVDLIPNLASYFLGHLVYEPSSAAVVNRPNSPEIRQNNTRGTGATRATYSDVQVCRVCTCTVSGWLRWGFKGTNCVSRCFDPFIKPIKTLRHYIASSRRKASICMWPNVTKPNSTNNHDKKKARIKHITLSHCQTIYKQCQIFLFPALTIWNMCRCVSCRTSD